ncbi:CehA/McbA family metallohydrolase [Vibrio sp. B1Z05]|uniref:CehA/McbA family metallohydrolase n=1 Tax=Vibrio sp. B1Z05 TaxID=2654980 RepID=UPI00128B0785|nr:CehA/McbA family metallohydrolase [Vibrio sp. B1Z05]MPW36299.1 hypothetical protein [Vibrio sp. B1Z05]
MTLFTGEVAFGRQRMLFDVPAYADLVRVTGTTVTKGFLYAAVYDTKHAFRGKVLFEKSHKSLLIQSQNSGFGAIDGEISAGEWYLELYNLEGEFRGERGMQYQVAVQCISDADNADTDSYANEAQDYAEHLQLTSVVTSAHGIEFDYSNLLCTESRWYRGDLHAHSQLSDGHNSLQEANNIVEAQDLDFFFFTEHNICQPKLPISKQCLFLPAIEVTTDLGHFNVHGPTSSLDLRAIEHSSVATIQAGLDIATQGHSSISLNHPMMKPWHWQYQDIALAQVSTFEVCCDPTWSTSAKATNDALLILTQMWNCGHRITAVGGSDGHLQPHERNPKASEPSLYGDPSTFVYSHGLSGEGILSGLRNGQVYIERRCGLQFAIYSGDSATELQPGQDSKGQALTYQLSVTDSHHPYYAECIVDGAVVARIALSEQPQAADIATGYAWCRVDIRRGHMPDSGNIAAEHNEFEGCINALFDGSKPQFNQPLVDTWGELMERINSDEV